MSSLAITSYPPTRDKGRGRSSDRGAAFRSPTVPSSWRAFTPEKDHGERPKEPRYGDAHVMSHVADWSFHRSGVAQCVSCGSSSGRLSPDSSRRGTGRLPDLHDNDNENIAASYPGCLQQRLDRLRRILAVER